MYMVAQHRKETIGNINLIAECLVTIVYDEYCEGVHSADVQV